MMQRAGVSEKEYGLLLLSIIMLLFPFLIFFSDIRGSIFVCPLPAHLVFFVMPLVVVYDVRKKLIYHGRDETMEFVREIDELLIMIGFGFFAVVVMYLVHACE